MMEEDERLIKVTEENIGLIMV
jgi:hypothetical protein